MSEAQFPRISLLGDWVNRGNLLLAAAVESIEPDAIMDG